MSFAIEPSILKIYGQVGCTIVPSGTWRTLAPSDAFILGLKELDVSETANYPLAHRHIYFGHCYKNQSGWKELLNRFITGNGTLLDLEFLTFENGARVAAFGRSAGFIGMAVGIMNWCFQQQQKINGTTDGSLLPTLRYFKDFAELIAYCRELLKPFDRKPRALIIGALGRCGRGAVHLAESVGLEPIKWDMNETKAGGPFEEILQVDILVNCIYLTGKIPPFIDMQYLQRPRMLSTVVDVSCDYTNPNNPLPIYNQATTFASPTVRVIHEDLPLDVVSIDHLPSLVPFDSSQEFADALMEHLLQCDTSDVWNRAHQLFVQKTQIVKSA